MNPENPFLWPVPLSDIGDDELMVTRTLSEPERATLAAHSATEAVDKFDAVARLRREAQGVVAQVEFVADVVQACVVTLEPVRARIREGFVVRYEPDGDEAEPNRNLTIDVNIEDEDPPEPLEGDEVDLGPVLAQHFILALDPYPRSAGALVPEDLQRPLEPASPFAVLKRLKDRN